MHKEKRPLFCMVQIYKGTEVSKDAERPLVGFSTELKQGMWS